jgi:large subunit ribosomal protein L23
MSAKRYKTETVSRARMYEVIRAPLITEKTTNGSEHSQVTFKVAADATKPEIKQAIEVIFGVKVASINTLNRIGKSYRTKFGAGKRKDTKRAIVTLKSGTIDIFTNVG